MLATAVVCETELKEGLPGNMCIDHCINTLQTLDMETNCA